MLQKMLKNTKLGGTQKVWFNSRMFIQCIRDSIFTMGNLMTFLRLKKKKILQFSTTYGVTCPVSGLAQKVFLNLGLTASLLPLFAVYIPETLLYISFPQRAARLCLLMVLPLSSFNYPDHLITSLSIFSSTSLL